MAEEKKQVRSSKNEVRRGRGWYAIHTYAGYENAVERNLKQRVESLGMQDLIFNVLVPTEKVTKMKNGKPVVVEQKIYPGYVLVDMIVTEDSWYVVRNTPRVTGFIGAGGTDPVPLKPEEVEAIFKRMEASEKRDEVDYEVGEIVKITDGPFANFEGKISSIDTERGKVKLLVSMFGRETPVELDFFQIKKL